MKSIWREAARPIIAKVIDAVGTDDPVVLRRALREAYPFGPLADHPHKIWLDEIKVQLGKKRQRGSQVKPIEGQLGKKRQRGSQVKPIEGQRVLFND